MSKNVSFDFRHINTFDDFYHQFAQQFSLPDWFGYNLDALWDMVSAGIELPVTITFSHMTSEQRIQFSDIINVMNDAQDMWEEEFIFALDITKSSN
ncbi:barstar family protein [Providencia rettgeri]|nr:barstar family protein [Providencia rettgeri]ELQ1455507.1 barstar family protein [Providencia rettgeri]ELR5185921.1 barstar family protein [Providencia rettgeri]EMB0749513.1 barstar family protein [Providencia rettgeri]